jgi:hypothetical protein
VAHRRQRAVDPVPVLHQPDLFRSRLIDVNELVGKMAVLGSLVVLLSAVYSLLLSWVGGGQQGIYLLNALVASFVILILFEPVRSRLENGINRWLLRQRHEMRGRLEALRRELTTVVAMPDLVDRVVTALEESRRVTDAAVYLLDPDGAGFDRAATSARARSIASRPAPPARSSIGCAPATSTSSWCGASWPGCRPTRRPIAARRWPRRSPPASS